MPCQSSYSPSVLPKLQFGSCIEVCKKSRDWVTKLGMRIGIYKTYIKHMFNLIHCIFAYLRVYVEAMWLQYGRKPTRHHTQGREDEHGLLWVTIIVCNSCELLKSTLWLDKINGSLVWHVFYLHVLIPTWPMSSVGIPEASSHPVVATACWGCPPCPRSW